MTFLYVVVGRGLEEYVVFYLEYGVDVRLRIS